MRDWWLSILSVVHHLWVHRRRMLLRAHKDRRQRTAALVAIGAILYVGFYSIYFYRNPGAAILLLLGLAAAAWMRRSYRRDDQTFPTLLSKSAPEADKTSHEMDRARDRVLKLWFLYRRASSELALKQQPESMNTNVITRSVLLSKLRASELEGALAPEERHLHFLPDGEWSEEDAVAVVARGAELEALLWAAGIQKTLRPIEDLNMVVSSLPSILSETAEATLVCWRDRYEIRAEASLALVASLRIREELRNRGAAFPELIDPELLDVNDELTRTRGDQGNDLVLGTKLVTECRDAELRIAFEQSGMRASALLSLTDL